MKRYAISFILLMAVLISYMFYPKTATAEASTETPNQVILRLNGNKAFVDGVLKNIDETDFEITPFEQNKVAYLPLRFLAHYFNADISWDEKTQAAVLKKSNSEIITIPVGKNEITVNGQITTLDKKTIMKNGRVYIADEAFTAVFSREYSRTNNFISLGKLFDVNTDYDKYFNELQGLSVIGSKENFIKIAGISEEPVKYGYGYGGEIDFKTADQAANATSGASAPSAGASAPTSAAAPSAAESAPKLISGSLENSADFSKTNIQVLGVDEGDVIKTDGEYIYYLRDVKLSVVKAVPADAMKVEYTVTFPTADFIPTEIYTDKTRLTVIGTSYYNNKTYVFVYDITDKKNIKKVREFTSNGAYNNSRKIGDTVYVISNLSVYDVYKSKDEIQPPMYSDSLKGNVNKPIDFKEIYYCPGYTSRNFTIIMRADLSKAEEPVKTTTFFGTGENLYMSQDNLYIATSDMRYDVMPLDDVVAGETATADIAVPGNFMKKIAYSPNTTVFKFKLLQEGSEAVSFISKSEVDGSVLNQFSMDEYDGYFRIATTDYNSSSQQSNNMFVLDKNMKTVGKITNIAPDERIYSVRFMGKRAYMVTFKQVDPLFAIDLSNPTAPKILGALKIPGYSDYLHPYDENHLIGFGKDTVVYDGVALYQGMKMSLFNVKDPTNPKELFVENIGDRGTDSDLLRNHRALLFSKEKNILAFPVSLFEKSPIDKNNPSAYGMYKGQGAYVYSVDLNKGFIKKGVISHEPAQALQASGMYGGDRQFYVDRIIYIGDNLYTVSGYGVKANAIADLNENGFVKLNSN